MDAPNFQAIVACPPLEHLLLSTCYYKYFSTQKCSTNGKNVRLVTEFWPCHLPTVGFHQVNDIKFLNTYCSLPFGLYILLTFDLSTFIFASFLFTFLLTKKMHIKKNTSRVSFPWTPNSCLSYMTTHWLLIKVPFLYPVFKKTKIKMKTTFKHCLVNLKLRYLYYFMWYLHRSISLCRNHYDRH